MPFGFPSGHGLLQHVISELGSPGSQLVQMLAGLRYDAELRTKFRDALRMARPPSIDFLLEHRKEFLDIGKAAIAACLIPFEQRSNLFPVEPSWYDFLLGRLADGRASDFPANQLSIVTFNYDRSLEYFLFTTLKNRWNLKDKECAALLNAVLIVHVYGQLGKLPEISDGSGRPYHADPDAKGVKQAVAEMVILHEADASSPSLREAQRLLESADTVCFLGFGYHPKNLERLQIKQWRARRILGTAFGLLEGQAHPVRTSFGGVSIELSGPNTDVHTFLRETILE
jgi:hypothetical protein